MTTGELPYRGTLEVQLVNKILDDAPDPRRLNQHIPRDFATICLKCLERDPNRRYRSAGDVAAELRRFFNNEPIEARPLSKLERLWRWARRKPATATSAALAAVVMIAGPVAAFVINAQRNALADHVRELDKLVIGQQEMTRDLRTKNAGLMSDLDAVRRNRAASGRAALDDLRRELVAKVVDLRYEAAVSALEAENLDALGRAGIHLGLGMLLTETGRTKDAIEHLTAARKELQGLVEQRPADPQFQAALADCCERLANLFHDSGDDAEAGQAAAEAIEMNKELAAGRQDAVASAGLLASYFDLPPAATTANPRDVENTLKIQRDLADRVIGQWPQDAAGIYEAACRLTNNVPVLILPEQSK